MPVNTNPYVFISYKREDRAYVKRLAGFLADQNISVWYDYELATGDRFARVIQKRIDGCVAVVAVMTPEAAASNWVLQEIDYAMQLGRRVLPLELRHYVKPITLVSLHHENVVGETLPSPSFVNQLRQLAPSLVPRSQQQRKSVTNPTPPTASALEPIGPGAAGSTTSGTHAGTSRTAPRGLADGRVKSLSEQSRVHTRRVEQHEASGPGRMAVEQRIQELHRFRLLRPRPLWVIPVGALILFLPACFIFGLISFDAFNVSAAGGQREPYQATGFGRLAFRSGCPSCFGSSRIHLMPCSRGRFNVYGSRSAVATIVAANAIPLQVSD